MCGEVMIMVEVECYSECKYSDRDKDICTKKKIKMKESMLGVMICGDKFSG